MECFLVWSVESFVETEEYMKYLRALWQFVSFVFVPQRRPTDG